MENNLAFKDINVYLVIKIFKARDAKPNYKINSGKNMFMENKLQKNWELNMVKVENGFLNN